MKELLEKFENKEPEIVFEWHDSETDAVGWVVINSLRGGAAGGGTRMRKGLDKREVDSLAKTMELKFTVAGPPIGGAKSGINFDPKDPRKEGVLRRWFKAVSPLLKFYYGTGGDMNVDEIHEVIPFTEDNGILHPQEGVLNGHFNPNESQKKQRIDQLRKGVLKVVEDQKYAPSKENPFVIADLITGYGVAHSIVSYYNIWGNGVEGKKVIVQGWGNVGSAAAYYLTQRGAKVVGIIDIVGGLIQEDGFSLDEILELYLNKNGNELNAPNMLSFDEVNDKIWDVSADAFTPCAASRIVSKDQVERMMKAGLQLIAPGANVPFADKEIFFGKIADYVDDNISLIPDFISNLGIARVFAYLMSNDIETLEDEEIYADVRATIDQALKQTHKINNKQTEIAKKSFEIILNQLV